MTTIKIHPNLTKEELEDTVEFLYLLKEMYWEHEDALRPALIEKLGNSRVSTKDLTIQLVNLTLLESALDLALRSKK